MENEVQGNFKALLPILIFVVLYMVLGVYMAYFSDGSYTFGNVPVLLVILIATLVAVLQSKRANMTEKLGVMAKGMADRNLITMLMIFLVAGIFAGVLGREGAASVANLFLTFIPSEWAVVIIFIVSAFVSLAMGTSVGTITIITPIAISLSIATDFNVALCIASVVGGAMFGDNLSFISDTTIAACQGQGCNMRAKFMENLKIATPAAILTVAIIAAFTVGNNVPSIEVGEFNLWLILPYVIVLAMGILGLNVYLDLFVGIIAAILVKLFVVGTAGTDIIAAMGGGITGMLETSMVAVMVMAMCGLITDSGGFKALLEWIKTKFTSKKGGMIGAGLFVSIMDVSCANNTVAIMVANPIAKEMSQLYDVSRKKMASILDTFSCVMQGIIPYGAQMLVAIASAAGFGIIIDAYQIIPFLFYPFMLLVFVLVFILIIPDKRGFEPEDEY